MKRRILISGAGIAGLTCAWWLARYGERPLVVEKAGRERTGGYMMDFFGNGWLVAERMSLLDRIRAVRYPISNMQFVNESGRPFFGVPIERLRRGFDRRYTFLLRSDLEHILLRAAEGERVDIRYDTSITNIEENAGRRPVATFSDGTEDRFDVVIGADGVHSNVRHLAFGPESRFSRFLGYAVAAFRAPNRYPVGQSFKIYQEPDRQAGFYPLSAETMDAVFVFRLPDKSEATGRTAKEVLAEHYRGAGWIVEEVIASTPDENITFFDMLDQIVLPHWSRGRVVLTGDACACLTLIAGQGASMAMLESYLLARFLRRSPDDPASAFRQYEALLKPDIEKRQHRAEIFAKRFIPLTRAGVIRRRWFTRVAMSGLFVPLTARYFTGKRFLNGNDDSPSSGL